jgi:hypothetical protein
MFEITSEFPFLNSEEDLAVYSRYPASTTHTKDTFKFQTESEFKARDDDKLKYLSSSR